MAITVSRLSNIKVFNGLENVFLEQVAARLYACNIQGPQLIYETGDSSTDIYFVKTGSLIARRYSADGKEVHFADINAGDYFGDLAAISQMERLTNVEALTPCILFKMVGHDFRTLIEQNAELCMRFLNTAIVHNRMFAERIFEFSTMPVPARVRREILRLAMLESPTMQTVTISPAPSHYEIASRTSTHREAVSRELSNLVGMEIVETGRLALTIKNIAHLKKLVAEDLKATKPTNRQNKPLSPYKTVSA